MFSLHLFFSQCSLSLPLLSWMQWYCIRYMLVHKQPCLLEWLIANKNNKKNKNADFTRTSVGKWSPCYFVALHLLLQTSILRKFQSLPVNRVVVILAHLLACILLQVILLVHILVVIVALTIQVQHPMVRSVEEELLLGHRRLWKSIGNPRCLKWPFEQQKKWGMHGRNREKEGGRGRRKRKLWNI